MVIEAYGSAIKYMYKGISLRQYCLDNGINIGTINSRINNLRNRSQATNEKLRAKNSIPNLLNQIMFVIPKSVQLTSIKNTNEKHIIINAQSEAYEQLAYFKGKLEIDEILVNVQSDSSTKQNGIIKVTIEGDLP